MLLALVVQGRKRQKVSRLYSSVFWPFLYLMFESVFPCCICPIKSWVNWEDNGCTVVASGSNTICHLGLAGHNRGRAWSPPKISGQNVQLNDGAARYAGSIIFHWAVSLICCAAAVLAERMLAKLWKVRILGSIWYCGSFVKGPSEWAIEM